MECAGIIHEILPRLDNPAFGRQQEEGLPDGNPSLCWQIQSPAPAICRIVTARLCRIGFQPTRWANRDAMQIGT